MLENHRKCGFIINQNVVSLNMTSILVIHHQTTRRRHSDLSWLYDLIHHYTIR